MGKGAAIARIGAVACLAYLTAGPAGAACLPDETTVLSCTARNGAKTIDMCMAGGYVRYAFGPRGGAPELTLSVPVRDIEHHPWNGIGRSIWESTTFRNAGHAYEVYISVDRVAENNPTSGGVTVLNSGTPIAQVDCDPGTATITIWAISDAREALGLCWDTSDFRWTACQ